MIEEYKNKKLDAVNESQISQSPNQNKSELKSNLERKKIIWLLYFYTFAHYFVYLYQNYKVSKNIIDSLLTFIL